MTLESSISVRNSSDATVMFHLEPWGEQIEMASGVTFVVAAEADQPGSFEVEHGEGKIVVWAWPSAVVKLLNNGEEIGISAGGVRPTVPPLPEG